MKPTRAWADLSLVLTHADLPVSDERAKKLIKDYTESILDQVIEKLQTEADNCYCTQNSVVFCDCTGLRHAVEMVKALKEGP